MISGFLYIKSRIFFNPGIQLINNKAKSIKFIRAAKKLFRVISYPFTLSVLEFGFPLNISNEEGKNESVNIFFLTGFMKNVVNNINIARI